VGWGVLSPLKGQAGSGEQLPCRLDCGQCKPLHWKSLPADPGAFSVVDVTRQVSRPSSCQIVAARTETSNREIVFIVNVHTALCPYRCVDAYAPLFIFSANGIYRPGHDIKLPTRVESRYRDLWISSLYSRISTIDRGKAFPLKTRRASAHNNESRRWTTTTASSPSKERGRWKGT